jgi:hypothetical protein
MVSNGNGRNGGPLTVEDLYSLEQYHRARPDFRKRVLEHKRNRQVGIGPIAMLYFEDRLTIQYQIQEMLRIERIYETEAIADELAAYNPLIPNGSNLKATFMIEIPDAEERRRRLRLLAGIEQCVYARIGESAPIFAIADEDLERSTAEKTSAVHFVRFEFAAAARQALASGALLRFGIEHDDYSHEVELTPNQRSSLLADFD